MNAKGGEPLCLAKEEAGRKEKVEKNKEKKNDELKTQRRIGGAEIHSTGMDFGRKSDCNFEMEGSGRKR